MALVGPLLLNPACGKADEPLNAGAIVKLGSDERFMFVAGIVEGLAMARYMQDGKKPEGMKCVYDWFYKDPTIITKIYSAFEHFPEYPPGTIVDVMVRKVCA